MVVVAITTCCDDTITKAIASSHCYSQCFLQMLMQLLLMIVASLIFCSLSFLLPVCCKLLKVLDHPHCRVAVSLIAMLSNNLPTLP